MCPKLGSKGSGQCNEWQVRMREKCLTANMLLDSTPGQCKQLVRTSCGVDTHQQQDHWARAAVGMPEPWG